MPADPQHSPHDMSIDAIAAAWLARRDRGLTAAEQDEYLHWLAAGSEHRQAVVKLERAWSRLDALGEWQPQHSAKPNPDLLAPPVRKKLLSFRVALPVLSLAAVVLGAFFVLQPSSSRRGDAARPETVAARPAAKTISQPQRLELPDGSMVVFSRDSRVEAAFTEAERRVRLVQGEAHFTVRHNPARPFIVEVGAVAVRDLGTAFDVRRAENSVEVLVTEGQVQIEHPAVPARPLAQGERAVVAARDGSAVVSKPSAAEVERTLAWQGTMLELADLPLHDAIVEFNARNRQQIVVADEETGRVRVGGGFRTDSPEAFVRVVEQTCDVVSERRADGTIVLKLAK